MFRSAPIAALMICIAPIAVGELPAQDSPRSDVATMLKVGPAGAGHQAAREAADRLSRLPAAQIGVILGGLRRRLPTGQELAAGRRFERRGKWRVS